MFLRGILLFFEKTNITWFSFAELRARAAGPLTSNF